MFSVDINIIVFRWLCYEFLFRFHDPNNKLSLQAINKKHFNGKYWNLMRRRLIWGVDQMGRVSGGRGKKRAIRVRGRGRNRLANGGGRGRGEINNIMFFRYHEQKLPGWLHDKKKLSIRALAQKYGVPYTSLQKRIAGTVTNMAPSSGRGKGNPHILAKSVEGKPKTVHTICSLFVIFVYKLDQPSE